MGAALASCPASRSITGCADAGCLCSVGLGTLHCQPSLARICRHSLRQAQVLPACLQQQLAASGQAAG